MNDAVTVVIVNYNGGQALPRCLAALGAQTLEHRVVVVDNASGDGSARMAHAAFPGVAFRQLRHNVGFCRAVNLAAEQLDPGGTMVVLNPDTVPEPDFLAQIVDPLRHDPGIAATAGTLTFTRAPDVIASAGIRVHRNGVALDHRLGERLQRAAPPEPVFGASGGAAAYRVGTFREAGGFPESYFLYLEDVDLSWRLRLRGWETVVVPGAVARHDYSASAGEGSALKRRLLARNRIWTLARCLPQPLWRRDRRLILGFDLIAAGYGATRRDGAAVRGRLEGFAALPLRLLERATIQAAATVDWEDLDRWLLPPVSGRELLRLRRLTARLATRTG